MINRPKSVRRALAFLELPTKVQALITHAQGRVKGKTSNESLPSPTPMRSRRSAAFA